MEIDFATRCRLCLSWEETMLDLYAEFDQGISLCEILNSVDLKVAQDDGGSRLVCEKCSTTIIEFYNLRVAYLENQRYMSSITIDTKIEITVNEENKELAQEKVVEEVENVDSPSGNISGLDESLEQQPEPKLDDAEESDDAEIIVIKPDIDVEPRQSYKPANICEICGGKFKRKSDLMDHYDVHSDQKKYVCPFCGKAFKRRTVLVKHKKLHTNPREMICDLCGKAFNDKCTLKTHIMLLHEKTRNFKCPKCELTFPLKATLIKHIMRHNPVRDKLYSCQICNMVYKDKSSLTRHFATKHGSGTQKFICICKKEYTTLSNLQKHQLKHHGTKVQENSITEPVINM